MKIKQNYVLRNVADHYIVVPIGEEAVHFNGIISLNKSGKILYDKLIAGAIKKDLVSLLMTTYDVEEKEAIKDVDDFIKTLDSKNMLE